MTEGRLRGLLRELREDALPADSLARVRMRVAERTRARRHWKFAWLMVAPLCALAIIMAIRSPAPPTGGHQIEPPAVPKVEPAVIRSQPRPLVRRKQVARHKPELPVLIRIETQDPEVVILLVGN